MADIKEKFDSVIGQFQDLNGLHPGLWPLAPRLLAAFGLFLFVLFVGWWFYWSTQLEEIDLGQQEEQKLKDTFKIKVQQSISLDALKEQRKLVLQYVSRMEKQLPSTAEYAAVLEDINSAANGRGLNMEIFKPAAATIKDYYAELPIEIQMIANYHDMAQFVADVAKLPRIVTLNNLTFAVSKDAKKPGIVMDGIAKTYRYLDPAEIAEQAALRKKEKEKQKEAKK
ncbi:type 4a pilus biogenesis protein PilO [Undibacterium fentianense]|uniref:Type 4a pilus biogenesis protein PilO n=1 Tax=Undibacterium fentianense TaxID=2828728 RepID=A0A941E8D5_9BURK|nr:type 4a pilus biogenesis protein PilO [Undibacterium fentianense]MBR7801643.1 type 4a pilus biogenesis protein PilO [Undibacterium fentianense]